MSKFSNEAIKDARRDCKKIARSYGKKLTFILSIIVLISYSAIFAASASPVSSVGRNGNPDEEIVFEFPIQESRKTIYDDLTENINVLLLLHKLYPTLFSYESNESIEPVYEPRVLRGHGWQLRASKRSEANNWAFQKGKSNGTFRPVKRGSDNNWAFRTGKRGSDSNWAFRTGKRGIDSNWAFRTGKRGVLNGYEQDNLNTDLEGSVEEPAKTESWQLRTTKKRLGDYKRDSLWKLRSGKK